MLFEELYQNCYKDVYRFSLSLTKDEDSAEDLAQEKPCVLPLIAEAGDQLVGAPLDEHPAHVEKDVFDHLCRFRLFRFFAARELPEAFSPPTATLL